MLFVPRIFFSASDRVRVAEVVQSTVPICGSFNSNGITVVSHSGVNFPKNIWIISGVKGEMILIIWNWRIEAVFPWIFKNSLVYRWGKLLFTFTFIWYREWRPFCISLALQLYVWVKCFVRVAELLAKSVAFMPDFHLVVDALIPCVTTNICSVIGYIWQIRTVHNWKKCSIKVTKYLLDLTPAYWWDIMLEFPLAPSIVCCAAFILSGCSEVHCFSLTA